MPSPRRDRQMVEESRRRPKVREDGSVSSGTGWMACSRLAEAVPDRRTLASPVSGDDLWLLGEYLRGRLTWQQRVRLAGELTRP